MLSLVMHGAMRSTAADPLPKGWSTLNVRPVCTCGLAKML
jgi:hypothetical protein